MSDIANKLQIFGFNAAESTIYLYLFEHIEASAYTIAKDTNMPKTSVYQTLERLISRGFINETKVNKRSRYSAEGLHVFENFVEDQNNLVASILPDLKNLRENRNFNKPSTTLYIGKRGIQSALEKTLESLSGSEHKQRYVISDLQIFHFLPSYFKKWMQRRTHLNVFSSVLLPHSAPTLLTAQQYKLNSDTNREIRYLSEQTFFEGSLDISDKLIVIYALKNKDPYAIVIESSELSGMLKQMFLIAWNGAIKK